MGGWRQQQPDCCPPPMTCSLVLPLAGWKIEDKMLGIFSKCLPALGNLQALQ